MSRKMYNPIRRLALGFFLAVLLATPALGQRSPEAVKKLLEERDRDIKALVGTGDDLSSDVKEKLRTVINDVIDFQAMGREALGRYWKGLTAEQQAEFVDTFSQIVRAQSLANLDVYRADVTYDDISVTDSTARVVTTTTYKETPTTVEYALRYDGKTWLATDIILDRVSTVEGYSRSFQSVIRKKGFDELMVKLHERLDDAESKVS